MQCQGMLTASQCGTSWTNWHLGPKWQLVLQQPSSVVISLSQPNIKWLCGEQISDLPSPVFIGFRVLADILDDKNKTKKTVSATLPVNASLPDAVP